MSAGEAPNATSLIALAFAGAVAALVSWFERRRSKKEPEGPRQSGDAQVVAASFIDKTLMERLIVTMTALHGEIVTLNRHAAELNERMHDEELVRAAAARIRENRP